MKRVLLNITASELQTISGDVSYYKGLLNAGLPAVKFSLIPSGPTSLAREARKIPDRLLNARGLPWLNRWLFRCARCSYVPYGALRDVDIVLSHITFPRFAGRAPCPPVIWSTQGISPSSYYNYRGKVTFQQVVDLFDHYGNKADRLLIWTHSGAEMLRRHCRISRPVHVVPPSLPPPKPASRALPRDAEVHLLFIGRDAQRKGLFDILAAWDKLGDLRGRVHFDIVSRVSESVREQYKNQGNIRFHENLSDDAVNQLFDRADVFLLPTHAETYGFVLIEAMARGCALVTCDYAPLDELVEHGKNGLLVKPGDSEGILQALRTMIQEPNLTAQFREANKQKYWNTFAPDKVAEEFCRVLSA